MHGDRLYFMDNLRALALLAGVLFHAALAYSPLAHPFFPTADRASSVIVDVLAWFLHLFRMPLFFVIAGFFTAMQVRRRGFPGMFRVRFVRIVVPFVMLLPIINAGLKASTLHAAEHAVHPSPVLLAIRDLLQTGDLPPMPPHTGHLWFLYYLMLLLVLSWAGRALEFGRIGRRLAGLHPAWYIGAWPMLLVPAMASVFAPHPAPESLLPQFWALAYYGSFFMFGYLMHDRPTIAFRHDRHAGWLLLGSFAVYAAYFVLLRRQLVDTATSTAWLLALLGATASVWMTIVCLCLGSALLQRPLRVLRPVADASYWTYVVHVPVLFPIQYWLMDLRLPWPAKFGIAVLLTMTACLVSYYLLVRRTPLAAFFASPARPSAAPADT